MTIPSLGSFSLRGFMQLVCLTNSTPKTNFGFT